MKRPDSCLLAAAMGAATAIAAPSALAQGDPHAGHTMPTPAPTPTPTPTPAATASPDPHAGHTMPMPAPAPTSASAREPAPPAMPPGHDMSTMPPKPPPPAMPPGHDMSTMPAQPAQPDPMAGHDMSTMPGMGAPAGTDLPAGNAPAPPAPTDHAADAIFGEQAMDMGRHHLKEFHGGQKLFQVLFNIAEYQSRSGRDGFEWDGEGWYGGDIKRLWVKTEGEGSFGEPLESAEVQALYSYAIGPYFWVQGGVRYDFKPNPSRVYATAAVEGLAPSFFDVEGSLFLSNKGELMARVEGYYDQRITQRLILQPRAEIDFAAQNSREIRVGAGLSTADVGLRLRYDIRREFAPYVGVQYNRAFGRTREYLRAQGEDTGGWSLLTGIRAWF